MIFKQVDCRPWLAAVALASLVGCSGRVPTYDARGRVAFPDGQPMDGGLVEFRALDSKPSISARGVIKSDGTFRLTTFEPDDGAVEGRQQVLIVPQLEDPNEPRLSARKAVRSASMMDPKYQSFETSGLTFTVSREIEKNDFLITIDRSPK